MDKGKEERLSKMQVINEIESILAKNGFAFSVFAKGKRTGTLSSVEDFMPETHTVTLELIDIRSS